MLYGGFWHSKQAALVKIDLQNLHLFSVSKRNINCFQHNRTPLKRIDYPQTKRNVMYQKILAYVVTGQ